MCCHYWGNSYHSDIILFDNIDKRRANLNFYIKVDIRENAVIPCTASGYGVFCS